MPLRVSLVNLQKFTFQPCVDCASILMLAPEQNIRSSPPVTYPYVEARLDREARRVDITVSGPQSPPPDGAAAVLAQGVDYWPLALARALDLSLIHISEPTR